MLWKEWWWWWNAAAHRACCSPPSSVHWAVWDGHQCEERRGHQRAESHVYFARKFSFRTHYWFVPQSQSSFTRLRPPRFVTAGTHCHGLLTVLCGAHDTHTLLYSFRRLTASRYLLVVHSSYMYLLYFSAAGCTRRRQTLDRGRGGQEARGHV